MLSQKKTASLKLKVIHRKELRGKEKQRQMEASARVQVYGLLPGESGSVM